MVRGTCSQADELVRQELCANWFADSKQAPAETMNTNYLMFHCMSVELAIEDLKKIHQQKQKKRSPTKALTGVVKKSYDINKEKEKLLKGKYGLNG